LETLVEATMTLETGVSQNTKEKDMSQVCVLDTHKQPLDSVHAGRARLLLDSGKVAVLRCSPCTIMLTVTGEHPEVHPLRLKIDPGSQTTEIALADESAGAVVWAAELTPRLAALKHALDERRAVRRGRRQRRTRSRRPRFQNRRRCSGWLPPSLESRVVNVQTRVRWLARLCPLGAISLELVTFDLQRIERPELSGTQDQQETLAGSEVGEYLLAKWSWICSSCGSTDVPLQMDHFQASANGGTERLSTFCLACAPCNRAGRTQDLRVLQAGKPDRLARLLAQVKAPRKRRYCDQEHPPGALRPAHARGFATGMRVRRLDEVPPHREELAEDASDGRGLWWQQDACGAPAGWHCSPADQCDRAWKRAEMQRHCARLPVPQAQGSEAGQGLQTGDIARAIVTIGSKQGVYVGRVLVRASGWSDPAREGAGCRASAIVARTSVHRSDGYRYQFGVRNGQDLPSRPPQKARAIPPYAPMGGMARFR
jgi:hypothetical protein